MTVGETLSNARRERGLSVDDVAADTRIRATLIRAIETDDYRLCGGSVYARGHIRSIARVVGVDAEPLIAEFDVVNQVERPMPAVPAQTTDPSLAGSAERRGPNWTAAMVGALVIICAIALLPLLLHNSVGGGKQQASPPHPIVSHTASSHPPVSPPPSAVAALPPAHATMLVRTLHGKTWLSITTKTGKTLFSGLLAAGQEKVFTSRHGLTYVIGNAPAVDVVVNGHDIGSPPSSGNVSRGNVTPGADTVQQA